MYAHALIARAPQHRFRDGNRTGVPVVPTNFQPGGPCGDDDCCPDCSQAPADYLTRDVEARPRIPSAFRRGMQGLGVSRNAYMQPWVRSEWGPAAANVRLPGTGPEESRPAQFHGLGAVRAPDPRIRAASDALAQSGFGNAALNTAGLHRYQVLSSAAHILQTISGGLFDRSVLNDYMASICSTDATGNVISGSAGDIARGRAIVSTIIGGSARLAELVGGSVGNATSAALTLIRDEIGEVENERREWCALSAPAPAAWTPDFVEIGRELVRRHGSARFVQPPPTVAMSTGVKVALGAAALGVFGALVYVIAK